MTQAELLDERAKSLTPREAEVFALWRAGKTGGEIAKTCGFKFCTAREYKKKIRRKLGECLSGAVPQRKSP